VFQWCGFKSRRGKNKNLTALKSNSNTVWFNFQTYIQIYISFILTDSLYIESTKLFPQSDLGTIHLTDGFLFRSEMLFRTTQELEYLFFLSRKARIFFSEFNIRLYDKNSESDFFFFLHQNQNIFFSNTGNQNIFFRKKT
jgi:Ni,Fe-hydrogenase I cytochrome b subunit